jgi:hypothetical protein
LFTNVPEQPAGSIHVPKYPNIWTSATTEQQAMWHLIEKELNLQQCRRKKTSLMCEIILV